MPDEREAPTPPEDQEREASLDQETLDALVGDSEPEGDDTEDLESLLSDLDDVDEPDQAVEEDASDANDMDDMEALLDQMETGSEAEAAAEVVDEDAPSDAERDEMNDLLYQATLADVEQAEGEVDETEDTAAAENAPEDDLESLLSDLDEPDEDSLESLLDDDEDASENSDDLDSLLDDLDDPESDADEMSLDLEEDGDDDLDSLFDDLDSDDEDTSEEDIDSLDDDFDDEDLGDLFEENLNVGVEEDVAHILATGSPAPASSSDESLVDEDILDDFKSVQESLISGGGEAGIITATVLILDDDEDNRSLFKDALDVSHETYNYIEVESNEEALEALSSQEANLILMNLDGEVGEAEPFLEQIASDPNLPAIPVVVNSTDNDLIETALRAGATDYFSRPLEVMDVEYQVPRKILNLIKLQRAEQQLAGTGAGLASGADDLDDLDIDDDMEDYDDLMLDDGRKDNDFDRLLAEDDALLPEDLIAGVSSRGGGTATATRRKEKKRLIPVTDQRRMIRERERKSSTSRDRTSKLPVILGMALLVIVSAGLSAVAVNYVMNQKQQEVAATVMTPAAPPRPAPVLQQPTVAQKDFEMAKQRAERPNTFQK